MASDNKIHMPGAFGGIMRYDEEYNSRFVLKPEHVIVFVALVASFVIGMKIFKPF